MPPVSGFLLKLGWSKLHKVTAVFAHPSNDPCLLSNMFRERRPFLSWQGQVGPTLKPQRQEALLHGHLSGAGPDHVEM